MEEILLVEVSGRVATVTLNRPAVRNALNAALRRALPTTMESLDRDESVDVIIVTGADPAFCAGIDLKELGGNSRGGEEETRALIDGGRPFGPVSKPVIGAINGVAITGGIELALNCDFLIASDRASFADTHARVGIQPGWGLTVLLPQAVGLRRAIEMSTSGNFVDARTALEWGLVNRVVAHDDLVVHLSRSGGGHRLERPGRCATDPAHLRGSRGDHHRPGAPVGGRSLGGVAPLGWRPARGGRTAS